MKRHPCELLDLKKGEKRVLGLEASVSHQTKTSLAPCHHPIWPKYLQLSSKQRSVPWGNHALHTVHQAKLAAQRADEEKT